MHPTAKSPSKQACVVLSVQISAWILSHLVSSSPPSSQSAPGSHILTYGFHTHTVLAQNENHPSWLFQRDDMEAIPGYLSLHQTADIMTLKWTPNQLMNGSVGDLDYERRCKIIQLHMGYNCGDCSCLQSPRLIMLLVILLMTRISNMWRRHGNTLYYFLSLLFV